MDPHPVPPDLNGFKTIIPPIDLSRTINVALYVGDGVAGSGLDNIEHVLRPYPRIEVTLLTTIALHQKELSGLDALVFSGGGAWRQADGLGLQGTEKIRSFVRNGGGYVGICAGAHLGSSAHDWTLGLVNVRKAIEGEWRRGHAFVDLELTDEGRSVFGNAEETFKCRYANGIIMQEADRIDLPPPTVLAYFKSEVSHNATTPGAMIDTPAIVSGKYGSGKSVLISPHPENTPGLEHLLPRALADVIQKD